VIVVDASAVLAIILGEPEATAFSDALTAADVVLLSPVNLWEILVRARAALGEEGSSAAEDLLAAFNVDIVGIDGVQARAAASAFARFGRSTAADLNLGDCFAYALAKGEDCALLFKGDDFAKTDVASAAAG
jgi:ribonuclease VapC